MSCCCHLPMFMKTTLSSHARLRAALLLLLLRRMERPDTGEDVCRCLGALADKSARGAVRQGVRVWCLYRSKNGSAYRSGMFFAGSLSVLLLLLTTFFGTRLIWGFSCRRAHWDAHWERQNKEYITGATPDPLRRGRGLNTGGILRVWVWMAQSAA